MLPDCVLLYPAFASSSVSVALLPRDQDQLYLRMKNAYPFVGMFSAAPFSVLLPEGEGVLALAAAFVYAHMVMEDGFGFCVSCAF